jgi:hypothetical protein
LAATPATTTFQEEIMNIDFHYGVIYVTSRLAGLDKDHAQIVAHACQYVDDATTNGLLTFEGGETFERFASAHEMFDYRNGLNAENRVIWVPFHFLPAAIGDTLEDQAVCRPNSLVAQAMVKRAIDGYNANNALHRLGVTLHVYIDTWAHQGFSGIKSDHNKILSLEGDGHSNDTWLSKLKAVATNAEDNVEALFLDTISGLGHGAALHFPDMPWATWKYKNAKLEEQIERDNLPDFIEAADMACKAVQGFVNKNSDFQKEPGMADAAKTALRKILTDNRSHDADARLDVFVKAIASGQIPGLAEEIPEYVAKGVGSWKHAATGIADVGDGHAEPSWSRTFEDSHYRKFHDAIKEHRFVVTQEILPAFNVRLA